MVGILFYMAGIITGIGIGLVIAGIREYILERREI